MEHTFTIELDGFKGIERRYCLEQATVLTGPNGTGKSACREGLVYALTGAVPAGKALDAVAKYFPPRGGTVTVYDGLGNWVRRGIERDHEKHKNTEVLECSDHEEDGETPDLTRWYASPLAINIAELLTLSPKKLRDFFLRLCGGGDPDPKQILDAIALHYSRNVAGPAATTNTLTTPDDLPDDIVELAREWTRDGGIWETLSAALIGIADETTADVMLNLGKVAKEERLGVRRAANEAQAAIRELEAEAEGARATAHLLSDRRMAVETAQANHTEMQERAARFEEAHAAKERAEKRLATARQAASLAAKTAEAYTEPGDPPAEPERDSRIPELEKELEVLRQKAKGLDQIVDAAGDAQEEVTATKKLIADLREQVKQHDAHPIAQADAVLAEIPDDAHPKVPELRKLIEQIAIGMRQDRQRLMAQVVFQEANLVAAEEKATITREDAEKAYAAAEKTDARITELQADWKTLQIAHTTAERQWCQALAAHHDEKFRYTSAQARAKTTAEALKQAEEEVKHTSQRVELANFNPKAVDVAEASLYQAKEDLQKAEEAAGVVKAYEDAVANAKLRRLSLDAWKKAESAIAAARERLVKETMKPLMEDVNEVLSGAARPERAYLELENKRGKEIFELGWKSNGSTVAVEALSGGQAALFYSALACAVVRRSKGKHLVLIEADPIDAENLTHLLNTLAPWRKHLDAVLVATARPVTTDDAWKVIHLSNGVKEDAE